MMRINYISLEKGMIMVGTPLISRNFHIPSILTVFIKVFNCYKNPQENIHNDKLFQEVTRKIQKSL